MAEYIEREALLSYPIRRDNYDTKNSNIYFINGIESVLEYAKSLPPADVREVKHGKWERCFEDWRKQIEGDKCSVCGFKHYGRSIRHYHYCPNCGAKIDKE